MYKLLSILIVLGLTVNLFSQSPHGAQFKVNCADCHTSAGWEIPFNAWDRTGPVFSKTTGWQIGSDTSRFSHTKTSFPLTGQHIRVDCRACHESLVFSDANSDCVSCHTDIHSGPVGKDCARWTILLNFTTTTASLLLAPMLLPPVRTAINPKQVCSLTVSEMIVSIVTAAILPPRPILTTKPPVFPRIVRSAMISPVSTGKRIRFSTIFSR